MKFKLAYLYVSLAILFWASVSAIGKLLLYDLTNLELMFYSFIFTILGLFFITLFQKKFYLLKKYSKKDYLRMAGLGFLGCYLYSVLFFAALKYAPAQEAFIVNYLWPLFVVIFAIIILKEKLNFLKILGIVLGFLGVYIVVTQGNITNLLFSNWKADILAILGAASYALFSVWGKKYKYETITSMLIYFSFSFVFVVITLAFFDKIPLITFKQFLGLAWIGVATNALAFVFWFKALEMGNTAKMANFIFLTPFLSLVYIYFILGETILVSSIVGLGIIVLGIIIQNLRN